MILGISATILILLSVVISIYCFRACFYSANKKQRDLYGPLNGEQFQEVQATIYNNSRLMEEVEFEPVTIQSFDGLTLFGRYYHQKDGAPVKILFHGYRSMALRDCAGGFLLARKMGLNILVVDQRAHGKSGGHVITLGVWERRDCLSWIRYINGRFGSDTPIILSGLSMGAATVIMATALPLPGKVLCVLADSPYTSPGEIIRKLCSDLHIPAALAYPFISVAARTLGGFHLEQASAIDAVGVSPIPILLLHGEEDRLVPGDMSQRLHELSFGTAKIALFQEAGHGLSYIIEPDLYEKRVFDFLSQFPELESYIQQGKRKSISPTPSTK